MQRDRLVTLLTIMMLQRALFSLWEDLIFWFQDQLSETAGEKKKFAFGFLVLNLEKQIQALFFP